ncbi:eukaryotic translation initiation factor 4 gamma 1-like isoform X2 [Epargyreus clarus]|uniref:eukaryotic translation initiation factor 4 gamma 1-like isoform X2 n=1 Tax=Epargyreus clarus TaxID=520877 RepID=UPI003C2C787D
MPMIVSPLFWEWFNIWLAHFLKDLYHELKMVALRGGNGSLNQLSHSCASGTQQGALDATQSLQTTLGMPQSAAHLNGSGGQMNALSVQFVPHSAHKLDQASRYSASSCVMPSHHYRLLAQPRAGAECYHPTGAAGAYLAGAGAAQSGAQGLRGQPAPQPSAPPAPQQDLSKTTMAGHTYVSQQNATPQSRPQYGNFQYRATQHGSRPNTHPRQQQPYIPSASSAPGPVVYHPTLVFQPTHMGLPQSYQQPRSSTPGYFPYMAPYISYTTPASHTPPYFYNGQQLPAGSVGAGAASRAGGGSLVPPAAPAPAAPPAPLPHQPPQQHIHPAIPGLRQAPAKRTSHRLPIINPITQQDIFSEIYSNDSQYLSGDSSERQTPQPQETSTHSIAEFTRMVHEVANQPTACESAIKSNFVTNKNVELPVTSAANVLQPQINAIPSINNNIVKSDILNINNENKTPGPPDGVETNETPVVSAISDSPVIVPKMTVTTNLKPTQKGGEPVPPPPAPADGKGAPSNSGKPPKQSKNKPGASLEDGEKPPEPAALPALPAFVTAAAPQPQRVREPRDRHRSEEKERPPAHRDAHKPNGPAPPHTISSVDSSVESISPPTSQSSETIEKDSTKPQAVSEQSDTEKTVDEANAVIVNSETTFPEAALTATELLSASIEKFARDSTTEPDASQQPSSSAIQAQAKLTQSIASCARNHPEEKMKDIKVHNNTTDPDTANGNSTNVTKTETVKEVLNRNEKAIKNSKNSSKKTNKMANNTETAAKETVSYENGKDETDKVSNLEQEKPLSKNEDVEVKAPADPEPAVAPPAAPEPEPEPEPEQEPEPEPAPETEPAAFVPKYKYTEDQWSPMNKSGKKCYDIGLLMQIKDDPMSRNKPDVPLLETCNVIRTTPMQEPATFNLGLRPTNNMLEPYFLKNAVSSARSNTPREPKKDGRSMNPSGKGSAKLTPSASTSAGHKTVYVSLSLREEVKLNQTKDAWKPARFKKDSAADEEVKTQELYKKFRGILNKLTPQKFDTLLDKVKTLEINTQARLIGVIDLVFEKAIDEPNFSEAYAAMCSKLSMLKVPADNAPDQCVNFRALIISRCQNQFVTDKVDEQVLKLEKELNECTDQAKKKELQLQLDEENRRVRMRSVGNVRFIGELYKLKMLTSKIMVYCMNYLIEKLEEEKLECLCKLLTTIGEQVESEVKEQLENVFKKMQDIVDKKSNKISSRVRFMLKDVIELRARKWIVKSVVVDSQPKMMDQIQKEAEQQQRHIDLMNSCPMGGFRRDEGGRGKRGDGRRGQPGGNLFMDPTNNWKAQRTSYTVDTTKLKAATQKNLNNIKLAPQNSGWNQGSGTKNTALAASNAMISISKNMYSVLDNVQADPTSLRASKDLTPSYQHSKSIERSTFNSRGDFNSGSGGGSRSGSAGVARSSSGSRAAAAAAEPAPPAPPAAPVAQEPLPEAKKKSVKATIDLFLIVQDLDEVVGEIKQLFPPQYHTALVTEILNVVLEKAAKEVHKIAKTMVHLVSIGVISAENYAAGIGELLEIAPDLFIDIPMLYDYLGKFLAPHIEKKHITFAQTLKLCKQVIAENHGHLILKAILKDLKESMGPTFVKTKWEESGLELKQWMNEDQVEKWLEENKLQFLAGAPPSDEAKRILTPAETQSKLQQLMNADESCECIRGWVQDNLGVSSREDWFMRALIQAICEHALFAVEPRDPRDTPHFSQERMNKYSGLINDFGEIREMRESSCLFGIQQLIHRLEHPQGLTLEIFQYLHEQYIISVEGFTAWEVSDKEPEGKAVMLKALTSFFTNIKEADNEDSCSED